MSPGMDENAVVRAVCGYLRRTERATITKTCNTRERGTDIEACRGRQRWYVEAKGGTSSRTGSARFGKSYSSSQVFDRVAKAFYTAAILRALHPERLNIVALAFPKTKEFENRVAAISSPLKRMRISLFWVTNSSVTFVR